jgi:hypothetical protein
MIDPTAAGYRLIESLSRPNAAGMDLWSAIRKEVDEMRNGAIQRDFRLNPYAASMALHHRTTLCRRAHPQIRCNPQTSPPPSPPDFQQLRPG